MEEVFGNFWREVLGEDDDSEEEETARRDVIHHEDFSDSEADYVRISRRRSTDGRGPRVATPGKDFPKITKKTFIGIVKVDEEEDGEGKGKGDGALADVLYRTREGKSTSVRVSTSDAHGGFVGKVLDSWMKAMDLEEEAEEEAEQGEMSKARKRRGASELSTSNRTIKTPLRCSAESDIMTIEQMESLREAIPAMYRMREWSLVYSTKRDGISLKSLYRLASGKSVTVLVVSDFNGAIFGAFCTETWKVDSRYGGTGESFVFTLAPTGMKYAWSGENDYYMLGSADSIAIGGGSAHAIRLEEDLLQGSSGECETFRSPPLASENMFKVRRIELWSMD